MDSLQGHPVEVWIYDLSKGLARSMSMPLLGKQIDGIWHTSIVVFGKEYFFGGDSIECCTPGGTIIGQPDTKVKLGNTEIPYEIFQEYLRELSQTTFRPSDYHLLHRNCNNFSSEVSQFLTGNDIPPHITSLPDEVLSTPFGQMIMPMLNSMTVNPGSGSQRVFGENAPSHRVLPSASSSTSSSSTASSSTASHRQQPITTAQLAAAVGPPTTGSSQNGLSSDSVRYLPEQVLDVSKVSKEVSSQNLALLTKLVEFVTSEKVNWSIGPPHIKALAEAVPVEQAWSTYQKLVIKSESLPALKRCANGVFIDQLNTDNLDSLKTLCNLCSTMEGYTFCLSTRRSLLEDLPATLQSSASSDHLECLLSTILNISIHHRLVDDLDIQYTCGLVEYLNHEEGLHHHTVELILKTLLNLMSRNKEVKLLAFTMGLDTDKYNKKSEGDNSTLSLQNVVDSLARLKMG